MQQPIHSQSVLSSDLQGWEAGTPRCLKDAYRQWDACKERYETVRTRFQDRHPTTRLLRSAAMRNAWAA
ncbi:MAG: hypothetical protein H6686_03040 [Fibrobacteria bacterium]|nr:hypothetical protein [Fibrobacteria bacterium]